MDLKEFIDPEENFLWLFELVSSCIITVLN